MTSRRACAIVIRGGDAEMSNALAKGIAAGRAQRLEPCQRRTVEDEIARQRARARLERMELHGKRDAKYWNDLTFEAEMAYGEPLEDPEWPVRMVKAVEIAWCKLWFAMLVLTGRVRA